MRRWHNEVALMRKRWKVEMGLHGYDWRCPPTDPSACHCVTGIGFFRKREPHDCGNPKCGICHWGKFWTAKKRNAKKRKAIEYELNAY